MGSAAVDISAATVTHKNVKRKADMMHRITRYRDYMLRYRYYLQRSSNIKDPFGLQATNPKGYGAPFTTLKPQLWQLLKR